MPRVYVVGALSPGGGNYMAYRLGCLVQRHFGYELFEGAVDGEKGKFRYDVPIKSVTLTQLIERTTRDDLLIVNAGFSKYLLGQLPCRKLCYVQDYKTFKYLDCHFDLYIAVSSLVQRFLEAVYDITAPIIPPYIELGQIPKVKPWHERPKGSALVYIKQPSVTHDILLQHLRKKLKEIAPEIKLSNVMKGRDLNHKRFLQAIGRVRYFVNLSLAEGFGLVPLEAMAMGTMVTGLDGLAGRDYMRHGKNCLISSITDLSTLANTIHQAFTDEPLAEQCIAEGGRTAAGYGYEPFKKAWLEQLSRFLKTEPVHV